MWVRLDDNNKVAEIQSEDPHGRTHPAITWIVAPDNITRGSTQNPNGSWDIKAPPKLVPATITNFQARAALLQTPGPSPGSNLFETVDAALRAGKDADDQGMFAWQAWEQANEFTRDGDLINSLGGSFGLSSDQLDDLFIAGSTITA